VKTTERYSSPAIVLHWLVALLIICAFGVGLKIFGMPLSPWKFHLIAWHKWLGMTILALVALRVVVRLLSTTPALPSHMSSAEQRVAHLGHLALYALMLAVPLSGWAMTSAYGIPVVYLGLWRIPPLLATNLDLAPQLKTLHQWLNWTLAACVVGHVAVALKHHYIDRDGLLTRMRISCAKKG
jgi:cytochrome b561